MRVIVPSEQVRGRRHHGCVIDEDVSEYVKSTIIYPVITPRMIFTKDYIYEPWENTKRRIAEVKRGETDGRNH